MIVGRDASLRLSRFFGRPMRREASPAKPTSIGARFYYAPEAKSEARFSHVRANPPVWGAWSKVRDGPSLNVVSVRPRGL